MEFFQVCNSNISTGESGPLEVPPIGEYQTYIELLVHNYGPPDYTKASYTLQKSQKAGTFALYTNRIVNALKKGGQNRMLVQNTVDKNSKVRNN